ncbi:MAG: antitoxin [Nocardioidaceae bacterium]|nr:antitoxin [Nocardioidaceae bacterium]
MSKRLQVVLSESEFDDLRAVAEDDGLTVSEWVRLTLRHARRQRSTGNIEQRLAAIRAAARHAFPTADVDQMLREVEQGYEPS